MKKTHIMTDIETLGLRNDATIIQIAGIAFDIETGEHISEFDMVADISKNEHMEVDGGTLKWWLDTDADLLKTLLNERGTVSSDDLIREFHSWMISLSNHPNYEDLVLWGNGPMFDNMKLKINMERLGLEYPILYKNDRDVRTILDLASAKTGLSESEIKGLIDSHDIREHDALDDVVYQIRLVNYCYIELVSGKKVGIVKKDDGYNIVALVDRIRQLRNHFPSLTKKDAVQEAVYEEVNPDNPDELHQADEAFRALMSLVESD